MAAVADANATIRGSASSRISMSLRFSTRGVEGTFDNVYLGICRFTAYYITFYDCVDGFIYTVVILGFAAFSSANGSVSMLVRIRRYYHFYTHIRVTFKTGFLSGSTLCIYIVGI